MKTRNMLLEIQPMFDYSVNNYVNDINQNFAIINSHNHTQGSGKRLAEDSIEWSIIDLKGNDLLNVGAYSFVSQGTITTITDPCVLWFKTINSSTEWFYTNAAGVPVQITNRGAVNFTDTIAGFYGDFVVSGASCVFDSVSDTYTFSSRQGLSTVTCNDTQVTRVVATNYYDITALAGNNLVTDRGLYPVNSFLEVGGGYMIGQPNFDCINGIGTRYVNAPNIAYGYPEYFSLKGLNQFAGLGFSHSLSAMYGLISYNGTVPSAYQSYLNNMHVGTNCPIEDADTGVIPGTLPIANRYSGCLVQTIPSTRVFQFVSSDAPEIRRIPSITVMDDNDDGEISTGRIVESYGEVTQRISRLDPTVVKRYKCARGSFSGYSPNETFFIGAIT